MPILYKGYGVLVVEVSPMRATTFNSKIGNHAHLAGGSGNNKEGTKKSLYVKI